MRILLIEDEHAMSLALTDVLQAQGWRVRVAADGPTGLSLALEESPDLIVLDVMLPGLDGFALCRELRLRGRQMPVLMLTARGQVGDRVAGLDAGADDYLAKPFAGAELLARVRALARRVQRQTASPAQVRIGEVEVDFDRSVSHRHGSGEAVTFTAREWRMLRLLVDEEGRPVSR